MRSNIYGNNRVRMFNKSKSTCLSTLIWCCITLRAHVIFFLFPIWFKLEFQTDLMSDVFTRYDIHYTYLKIFYIRELVLLKAFSFKSLKKISQIYSKVIKITFNFSLMKISEVEDTINFIIPLSIFFVKLQRINKLFYITMI